MTSSRRRSRPSPPHSSTSLTTSSAVRRLHGALAYFGSRRLTWDDAMDLCARIGVTVAFGRAPYDAQLLVRQGRTRIFLDDRIHRPTWGVFCVVHELAHALLHPGDREHYLGSPGWEDKIESQANLVALHALWPGLPDDVRVVGVRTEPHHVVIWVWHGPRVRRLLLQRFESVPDTLAQPDLPFRNYSSQEP